MLTDEAMKSMNDYAKDGKALRSTLRRIIKDLTGEVSTLQQQNAKKQELLEWAARIIDSGMGAGILRYDPIEWFLKYHSTLQSLQDKV